MFHTITINPRFCETDAAGHINNTSVMPWLEEGRVTLRRAAETELLTVLVRIEVDYIAEIEFGSEVVVKTGIDRIGTKSVAYAQEVWQKEQLCIRSTSIGVGFDTTHRKSCAVSDEDRQKLSVYVAD